MRIRRRAAAKRKKLKLVSRPGGGLGADGELPPEELEEDPEEDSSLAGTGQGGPHLAGPRGLFQRRWREEQPSISKGGRWRISGHCQGREEDKV